MLNVTLATFVLAIRDRESEIGPLECQALLADNDDVPALLGMQGVLAELTVHTSVGRDEAYLEFAG